jgi:hypothetical protein
VAGFPLAAVAGIAVGLSLGAVATVGVTLAVADRHDAPQIAPAPASPHMVNYGGPVCYHGHCVSTSPPCTSAKSCYNKLPPGWRP